jgi:hypothetical protein
MAASKTFAEKWQLRLAEEKIKSCKAWGQMGRGIIEGCTTPLELEHWFCAISKRINGNDEVFQHSANTLRDLFTPNQRSILALLFWKILGEHASRHRQANALRGSHQWDI